MIINKGKKQYPIKIGDKILDNGVIFMFIPKDNSILPFGEWYRKSSLTISKKEVKRIFKIGKFKSYKVETLIYYVFEGDKNE
jgi:hypothetical protein